MRIIVLVFLLPWVVTTQIPITTYGQCQAFCLSEYAAAKEYFTLLGDSYQDVEIVDKDKFNLCKLGCQSPHMKDIDLPPIHIGQRAYHEITKQGSVDAITRSPVSSVGLLCVDLSDSLISGRLVLNLTEEAVGLNLVHYIEAVGTDENQIAQNIFWQLWAYNPVIDFSTTTPNSTDFIQFRVQSFSQDGLMGQLVKSNWISGETINISSKNQIDVIVDDVIWKDETASAKLSFPELGNNQLTVCSMRITYVTHTGHKQVFDFTMDRSRGYVIDRLSFHRNYTVHVAPTSNSKDLTSQLAPETVINLPVPKCLALVTDSSMCSPPPVDMIEWKWNRSRTEGNFLVLAWSYGSLLENDSGKSNKVAYPTNINFQIETSPIAGTDQPHCQLLKIQRREVSGTHRSIILHNQDDRCNYVIGITVFDSRNRKSSTEKVRVVPYDEAQGMLALSTAQWNFEMFLLVIFLLALLIVAGGMAVCRIRDRSEFNTLKREHRQLTKSIVVAQSASTLPRSHCLTIVDGRGRPISSDESEISNHINNSNMIASKSPQYYPDEGVYDSLDTPTRSEASYFDRLSSCSLTRANPIYSGINLHGVMALPFDRLHVTQYHRSSSSGWSSCHALDKTDGSAYLMKYSADDSASLRHELGIVSRISTDHPGLLYFQGLAVRESQALGVLFEPIRGGTLNTFLSEVRTCLFDRRNDNTPSPASSGYDGSNQSHESLDRFQQKIDRLTVHLYTFSKQIASAVNFLHLQNCVHGSITTNCIYLLKSYRDCLHLPCDQMAKLGDYEHSIQGETILNIGPMNVSPSILPPEVINGKVFAAPGDIWQFGLLLSEIVTLGVLNSLWESSEGTISDKSIKNFYSRLSTGHDNSIKIDPGLVQLKQKIPKCLLVDPKKRTSAKDLVKELSDIQPQPVLREHMESVEV
ncbi:unnamed protein product [Auanema sp. JU1783]|nr:unnamed protein product [Auanema sp. JU1783]